VTADRKAQGGYVVVDLAVLQALRELAWVTDYDRHTLGAIRLVLRVARIDPITGRLVIAVSVARDLDTDPPERGSI
jgi:hypothetical protein